MYGLSVTKFIFICILGIQLTKAVPNVNTIDNLISRVFKCQNKTGLTVAIVKDGKTIFQKGYGYKDTRESSTINTKTLFGLASLSKAFASTLIVKLVAERTDVTLDTPLKDILKNDAIFADDLRSEYATLRDLLGHRLAIPGNNAIRMNTNLTRENLVRRLKYLPATGRFRDTFIYNNLMYGLLTYIAEILGGKKWEELITEHLFRPLGMTHSSFATQAHPDKMDIAQGYFDFYGELKPVPWELSRQWGYLCGSGCVLSNAEDMSKWMLFHLNGGVSATGKRVMDEDVLKVTHTPQATWTFSSGKYFKKPKLPVTFSSETYGMGWMNGEYRGHNMIFHSGSTWGYRAFVTLYTEANVGIFTAFTGDDYQYMFRIPLQMLLADLYLGEETWLNASTICTFPEPFYEKLLLKSKPMVDKSVPLSRKASAYTGLYNNHAYGNIEIIKSNDKLTMKYGTGTAVLYPKTTKDEFYMEFFGLMETIYHLRDLRFVPSSKNNATIASMVIKGFDSRDPPIFTKQGLSVSQSTRTEVNIMLVTLLLVFVTRVRFL